MVFALWFFTQEGSQIRKGHFGRETRARSQVSWRVEFRENIRGEEIWVQCNRVCEDARALGRLTIQKQVGNAWFSNLWNWNMQWMGHMLYIKTKTMRFWLECWLGCIGLTSEGSFKRNEPLSKYRRMQVRSYLRFEFCGNLRSATEQSTDRRLNWPEFSWICCFNTWPGLTRQVAFGVTLSTF